jgi:hypothetical protein
MNSWWDGRLGSFSLSPEAPVYKAALNNGQHNFPSPASLSCSRYFRSCTGHKDFAVQNLWLRFILSVQFHLLFSFLNSAFPFPSLSLHLFYSIPLTGNYFKCKLLVYLLYNSLEILLYTLIPSFPECLLWHYYACYLLGIPLIFKSEIVSYYHVFITPSLIITSLELVDSIYLQLLLKFLLITMN